MLGVQGALPHCEMKTYGILYCIFSCVPFVYLKKKKILLLLRYIFIFAFFRFLLLLNLLYLLCRVLNIFVPCMNGYNES